MSEGRYAYGLHARTGQLVHVDQVPRGLRCGCVCPACKAPLVAKKGTVYKHHFAHETATSACEGALHTIAKRLLAERIQRAIDTQSAVPMQWQCGTGANHEANLLTLAEGDATALELWLPQPRIRPDITLSLAGEPRMLLEVVVTHEPEYDVSKVGLPILELHLGDEVDLELLAGGTVPFARVHNLKCGCGVAAESGDSEPCSKCGRACGSDELYYSDYLGEYPLCRSCLPSSKDMTHVCKACGNSFAARRYDHDLCRDCWGQQYQREQWELWHCNRCRKRLKHQGYTYCFSCNRAVQDETRRQAQQAQAAEEELREARRQEAEEELDREGQWLNDLVRRNRRT